MARTFILAQVYLAHSCLFLPCYCFRHRYCCCIVALLTSGEWKNHICSSRFCGAVQLSAALLILSLIHYGARHGPSWLDHFKWLAIASVAIGGPRIALKALNGLRHLVGTHGQDTFMIDTLPSPFTLATCPSACLSYGRSKTVASVRVTMLLACHV